MIEQLVQLQCRSMPMNSAGLGVPGLVAKHFPHTVFNYTIRYIYIYIYIQF